MYISYGIHGPDDTYEKFIEGLPYKRGVEDATMGEESGPSHPHFFVYPYSPDY